MFRSSTATAQTPVAEVNFFQFLSFYLRAGNFYDAISNLENKHAHTDFKVTFAFLPLFYIIQNKIDVKKVLTANAVAGYQNHNFDVAHGHMLNINAVPAFSNGQINPVWQAIHSGLAQSIGDASTIKELVGKHIYKFFPSATFSLDIAFESFIEGFWAEFMFGSRVDAKAFAKTRNKLMTALRYSYYDSRLKNIPYVGTAACKLYGYMKKEEFAEVDNELKSFLAHDEGLMSRFRYSLQGNQCFSAQEVKTAVLDNTFVLILALDFIQNAMYETLKIIVENGISSTEERKKVYANGLHDAFLFPFRVRVPQQDLSLTNATVGKGVPIYINLLASGFYHSAGPRMCVGMALTQWVKEAIFTHLKEIEFSLLSVTGPKDRKALAGSRDVPISPERLEVSWAYSRDYLQKTLPHYAFKGVNEFYDVLKIYEKPLLFQYVTSMFLDRIKKINFDTAKLCIVTPEVRGIPIASAVAKALNVPLLIIRKHGKIPGDVISSSYKNAYANDVLELSATADVKDKQIIMIDDGVASGGTTLACCDLIKRLGGQVNLILAMINHTYASKDPGLSQYLIGTLFDFEKPGPSSVLFFQPKHSTAASMQGEPSLEFKKQR